AAAEDSTALTLPTFLAQVGKANLELMAQRANVSIAEAQIAVARVFPDPTLTGGVSQVDVSGQGAPLVSPLGVTQTVELGGKRGGRIAAAQADERVAQADLEDFFRKLRASAATAYVDSLYARLALERKQRTLASLERLLAVNQHRFAAGDIGE